jgi:uncharacterized membrane protein YtjA (UPF0391 family)
MLRWSFLFLVIAIIAGVLGFTGVAAGAASIAKILFFIFLGFWILMLILGITIFMMPSYLCSPLVSAWDKLCKIHYLLSILSSNQG